MPPENITPEQVSSQKVDFVTHLKSPLPKKYIIPVLLILVLLVAGIVAYGYFLLKSTATIEPVVVQPDVMQGEPVLDEREKMLAEELDRIVKEDAEIKPLSEEELKAELERVEKEDAEIKPLSEEELKAELERVEKEDPEIANTQ